MLVGTMTVSESSASIGFKVVPSASFTEGGNGKTCPWTVYVRNGKVTAWDSSVLWLSAALNSTLNTLPSRRACK